MKSYYVNALLEDGTELQLGRDGLLYKITLKQAEIMLKDYPQKGSKWYFNNTFDRACAELDYDDVIVNPSVIARISPLLVTDD